jgi:hypothetical protein
LLSRQHLYTVLKFCDYVLILSQKICTVYSCLGAQARRPLI